MNPVTVQPTRDQLRALADAATPGPWEAITDRYDSEIGWYMGGYIPHVADEFRTEHDGEHPPLGAEDAAFIAAARTAVPQLLDQLDQQEAELDSWMTRAYEAEQRAWQAEARIKAVENVLDKWQVDGYDALLRRIRRAPESVPPPSA